MRGYCSDARSCQLNTQPSICLAILLASVVTTWRLSLDPYHVHRLWLRSTTHEVKGLLVFDTEFEILVIWFTPENIRRIHLSLDHLHEKSKMSLGVFRHTPAILTGDNTVITSIIGAEMR